jgi:hypothetical protein
MNRGVRFRCQPETLPLLRNNAASYWPQEFLSSSALRFESQLHGYPHATGRWMTTNTTFAFSAAVWPSVRLASNERFSAVHTASLSCFLISASLFIIRSSPCEWAS